MQHVRLVVGPEDEHAAGRAELGLEGDDLPAEHGLLRGSRARAEGDLELRPEHEARVVDVLELRVGEPDDGRVRQEQVVVHPDLLELADQPGVERGAVELHVDPDGGHAASPGIARTAPARRRVGSSMPLARARPRQRVGSP